MKQSRHAASARKQLFQAMLCYGRPRPAQPTLGDVYHLPYGPARRAALMAYLRRLRDNGDRAVIYVNCRYQANLIDPDLQHLLKKGLLVRSREGGGRQHPLNKTSRKRQTILCLANRKETR